jgi:hypothetical protein
MDDTDCRMPPWISAIVGGPGCAIARSAHVALRQYYLTKCNGTAPVAPSRMEEAASIIGGSLGISGPAALRRFGATITLTLTARQIGRQHPAGCESLIIHSLPGRMSGVGHRTNPLARESASRGVERVGRIAVAN